MLCIKTTSVHVTKHSKLIVFCHYWMTKVLENYILQNRVCFVVVTEKCTTTNNDLLFSLCECVSGQTQASSSFESRVVVVCEKMMSRACWAKSKHLIHSKTFRGMTLLHLAAGQGYATLIQTLIKWR